MRSILTLAVAILCGSALYAQTVNPWSPIAESDIAADPLGRVIVPEKYRTLRVDMFRLDGWANARTAMNGIHSLKRHLCPQQLPANQAVYHQN